MWPDDEIIRADPAALEKLDLPEETKRFLVKVGVPRSEAGLEFVFEREGLELLEYAGPPLPGGTPTPGRLYYRIGTLHNAFHVVLEKGTGKLVLLPNDGGWRDSGFVNSSLEQFVACSAYHRSWREQVAYDADGLLTPDCLERLTTGLLGRDRHALSERESWWEYKVRECRDECG